MRIKGIELGNGQPVVCVPVMGETRDSILMEAKACIEQGAAMIEWRVDYFADAADGTAVEQVLDELEGMTKNVILLFTYRSKKQGGTGLLAELQIRQLLYTAAAHRSVDLVDVEFYQFADIAKLMAGLRATGGCVVASHHNFAETPATAKMRDILTQMQEAGADIVKLAVMPQCSSDVLDLMQVTEEFYKKHTDTPVVTMSMRQLGVISRLSGELTGSCITFGAHGKSSAPGQIEQRRLRDMLSVIHEGGETCR